MKSIITTIIAVGVAFAVTACACKKAETKPDCKTVCKTK